MRIAALPWLRFPAAASIPLANRQSPLRHLEIHSALRQNRSGTSHGRSLVTQRLLGSGYSQRHHRPIFALGDTSSPLRVGVLICQHPFSESRTPAP